MRVRISSAPPFFIRNVRVVVSALDCRSGFHEFDSRTFRQFIFGVWRQLAAHVPWTHGYVGSFPTTPTNFLRRPEWLSGDSTGFVNPRVKSTGVRVPLLAPFFALVIQLVEYVLAKDDVVGS